MFPRKATALANGRISAAFQKLYSSSAANGCWRKNAAADKCYPSNGSRIFYGNLPGPPVDHFSKRFRSLHLDASLKESAHNVVEAGDGAETEHHSPNKRKVFYDNICRISGVLTSPCDVRYSRQGNVSGCYFTIRKKGGNRDTFYMVMALNYSLAAVLLERATTGTKLEVTGPILHRTARGDAVNPEYCIRAFYVRFLDCETDQS